MYVLWQGEFAITATIEGSLVRLLLGSSYVDACCNLLSSTLLGDFNFRSNWHTSYVITRNLLNGTAELQLWDLLVVEHVVSQFKKRRFYAVSYPIYKPALISSALGWLGFSTALIPRAKPWEPWGRHGSCVACTLNVRKHGWRAIWK